MEAYCKKQPKTHLNLTSWQQSLSNNPKIGLFGGNLGSLGTWVWVRNERDLLSVFSTVVMRLKLLSLFYESHLWLGIHVSAFWAWAVLENYKHSQRLDFYIATYLKFRRLEENRSGQAFPTHSPPLWFAQPDAFSVCSANTPRTLTSSHCCSLDLDLEITIRGHRASRRQRCYAELRLIQQMLQEGVRGSGPS